MKSLILVLFWLVGALVLWAQTPSEHITFKGVPIDGTLNEFVEKVKQKGFTQVNMEENITKLKKEIEGINTPQVETLFKLLCAIAKTKNDDKSVQLKGDFAGYKNCSVYVRVLDYKNLVDRIGVVFPECDTWSVLSSNYFSLKEMLSKKYGSPSDCIEKFLSYSEPQDDRDRMYEVRMDRCEYNTIWQVEKGEICLSIQHGEYGCFVMLRYTDKINSEIMKAEAINDL